MVRCWIFWCLLLVLGLVSVLADDYEDADDVSVEEEFARIDANMTRILDTVRKRINQELAPFIGDVIYDPRLAPQCAGALLKLGLGLQNLDHWAVEMIDASGKPPSGALRGRLGDYGSYDECLNVRHPLGSFRGRYCMLHLKIKPTPLLLKLAKKFMDYHDINYVGNFSLMSRSTLKDQFPGFKLGVCIPSTCQQEDLQLIIDTTIRKYGIILEVSNCKVQEPVKVDRRQLLILCVFGSWLFLIIAGTAYDICLRWITPDKLSLSEKPKGKGVLSKVARSFSLIRNTRKLLSVSSKAGDSAELGVIHGIRVFSSLWVVLGHSYIFLDPHNDGGLMYLLENINSNFLFSVQMNSFLAVESFFTMTGFLMSYLAVKNYKPGVPVLLVVPMALFRRYIRLIVPMMAVLGFVYLIPLMMSGPLLDDIWSGFDKSCNHVWWWVATMTHNYQHAIPEYCMPHYWYVSVDFQLIIGASLLLAVLPRWPKQSLWFAGAVAVASALYTVIHTHVGGYYPTALVMSTDLQKLFDTADTIYMKPYSHAGPVAVGIIFGWLAVQRHKLSRLIQAACWTVATAVGLTCLFSIWSWNHKWNPTGWGPALYGGLHRTAWALVVNWLLYACVTGRGGLVGRMLQWEPFYPLGRLSYGLYLIHVVVLVCNIMSMRDRKSEQGFLQIQYFIGAAAISYVFAYILYVTIEAPIGHLDNLLFSFTKRYKKENDNKHSQPVHNQCNGNHREVFVLTDSKVQ